MFKKLSIICIGIFAALAVSAGEVWAADVAMVANVLGDGVKYISGDRAGEAVEPADFLNAGYRIEIPAGSKLMLNYFPTGIREEISGPAIVTVGLGNSTKEGQGEIKSEVKTYTPGKPVIEDGDSGHRGAIMLREMKPPDNEFLKMPKSE